jgi:hypothetical protein
LCALAASWQKSASLAKAEAAWIAAFEETEPAAQARAAEALGDLGARSPASLAALVRGLESENQKTRALAAKNIARSGYAARAQLPTLVRLARDDPEFAVRDAALNARDEIRRSTPPRSAWTWLLTATLLIEAGLLAVWWRDRRRNRAQDEPSRAW